MKKKLLALPLLSLFCLTSCGNKDFYGIYSFKMGRSGKGETQIGLSINLTNNEVKDEKEPTKVLGKEFELELVTGAEATSEKFKGYYNYNESTQRVKLNAQIEIEEKEKKEKYIIPGDLLQYIALTYINKDMFTLKLPVSAPVDPMTGDINILNLFDNDLMHQLVWYGFYFDVDSLLLTDNLYWDLRRDDYLPTGKLNSKQALPGDEFDEQLHIKEESIENRLGSHPKYDDKGFSTEVLTMNAQFSDIFSKARFYNYDKDKGYTLIGSAIDKGDDNYWFCPLNKSNIEKGNTFSCYIKDELLGLASAQYVKVELSQGNYNIAKITKLDEQGSETGETILASDYCKQQGSFTFRDYHEIVLDLRKE